MKFDDIKKLFSKKHIDPPRGLEIDGHVVLNYDQINNFIFVGTNMCCQTHFEEELLEKGIRADLSLEGERMDTAQGVDSYLWLPIPDHTAPSLELIHIGIRYLEGLEELDQKVYIHCKNGHGRGPTMAAAYLIYKGMTVKEAVSLIIEKRPSAHLEDVQLQALEDYYEALNVE